MGKCIQVGNRSLVPHQHAFLSHIFKVGMVPFALCAKRIDTFKVSTVFINRKSQIIRNSYLFCIAEVFPAVIKVFMDSLHP